MYVHSNDFCFLSLKFMPLDIFFLEIKLLISSKLLNACSLRKKNNLYDYCQQIEHLLHFDKAKVLLLTNTPCGLCVINRLVNFVVVNDS